MVDFGIDWIGSLIGAVFAVLLAAAPTAVGIAIAAWHLRKGRHRALRRQVWAASAAAGAALFIMGSELFGGEAFSRASLGNFLFVAAAMWASIAFAIGYGLGHVAHLHTDPGAPGAKLLLAPMALLSILIAGALKYTVPSVEADLARQSTSADTLRHVDPKINGANDRDLFVSLDLAANRNSPSDVLDRLARHPHGAVRLIVSHHDNASRTLLWALTKDCDPRVRERARERIGAAAEAERAAEPVEDCLQDHAPTRALR